MRLLLAATFLLMGVVRLAIMIVPFRRLSPFLGIPEGDTPDKVDGRSLSRASKVGWSVEMMSRYTPWESKCLVRAVTAQLLLRGIRIPSTLYLGIGKDDSNHLMAHAWLRCGHLILTGASEVGRVRKVAQFASRVSSKVAAQ